MEPVISELTMVDYEEALALWKGTAGIGLSGADERCPMERFLIQNQGLRFTARMDGRIVGTVLCGSDGRGGCPYPLAVDDQFRHRGIGRAWWIAALANCGRGAFKNVLSWSLRITWTVRHSGVKLDGSIGRRSCSCPKTPPTRENLDSAHAEENRFTGSAKFILWIALIFQLAVMLSGCVASRHHQQLGGLSRLRGIPHQTLPQRQ